MGCWIVGGAYWFWAGRGTNILPYAMVLLCPLMHLFMCAMLGKGHHYHGRNRAGSPERTKGNASYH